MRIGDDAGDGQANPGRADNTIGKLSSLLLTRVTLFRALLYLVFIPVYLYSLFGVGGILSHPHAGGAALLWTLVMGALALYTLLPWTRISASTRDVKLAYVGGYVALAAWAVALARLDNDALFLFYPVVAVAMAIDRRLGRGAVVACVAIVALYVPLVFGLSGPASYVSLLPWLAGLIFMAATTNFYQREQQARARSDQLLVELQEAHQQLQTYAGQVSEIATLRERHRLAQELHDSVTQTLFAANLTADALPRLFASRPDMAQERLEELRQLTRGALAEMRLLLLELRPAALTQVGLGELLRHLANVTSGRMQIAVELTIEGERSLPPDTQVTLYRIAQEALNNVVKHSMATHVAIDLCFGPREVILRVRDDGQGFDPTGVPAGHLGLRIMRERAEALGATLRVAGEPGDSIVEVVWLETDYKD